ncbi:sodium-dependent nutrient amino acid transporter 1-like [Choristoneura fumiferana]|uniref:sodium-dependent nutrient amino acid transporter 1-like n=1 Tax=Choristoneura fumiferana TaxID=7141 RepID=UPI003D15AEEC
MEKSQETVAENGQTNVAFDTAPETTIDAPPPESTSANGHSSAIEPTVTIVDNGPEEKKFAPPFPEKVDLVTDEPRKKGEDRRENRPKWDNQIEFLFSCIAMSVGLGNVWRFPFVAYNNGGGAFLIPYLIVLAVIGMPMYFLETVLGQFSSSNCVRVWALSPAMKGTGYAQALGAGYVLSYYVSIIALCLYYLAMSFQSTLPWAICQPEWENCVPSGETVNGTELDGDAVSSAELYFTQTVLRQLDGIEDGIGTPLWDLTLCLLASWIIIFVIVARGVKSSGKAAYFLAIFPYIVLFILLIRAVTLPGAGNGIAFFFTPEWEKILTLEVWYAAVTQVFFSLSVCSGALIMFASYNSFTQNVYRDSIIVSILDTCTSMISGITIFGILGNLAYELNYDNIEDVIGSGGTGLAFISYPDAIAKSPFAPQLFSVLFFLMMAVLGVGSGVGLLSTINTVLLDAFPRVPTIYMATCACISGFLVGLVYVTPGGQYILEIVDYYGGTFMRLFAAIIETIGIFWIYGLENLCLDIEFMLGVKPNFYWRICWSIITPFIMIAVFMYAMIATDALVFGDDYVYPREAYIAGNMLQYIGMALIPIFIGIAIWKRRSSSFVETIKRAFGKKPTYGPQEEEKREQWRQFRSEAKYDRELHTKNWFHHIFLSLFGGHRKKN